jgi:hypothetical protein
MPIMAIMAIFIKELQVRMDDRTPVDVQGKKLTAGEYAGELLTWLAKRSVCRGFDNDPYAAPRDAILWLYTLHGRQRANGSARASPPR